MICFEDATARNRGSWPRTANGEIERVVGGAGVAVGVGSDAEENIVGGFDVVVSEAALLVGDGALQEVDNLRRREWIENVHFRAREKRRDDFERRIFGGRADESDVAGFDVGKKSVLLGLVEAMDLVDENDGALSAV